MRIPACLPATVLALAVVCSLPAQIVIRKSGSIDVFVEATPADNAKTSTQLRKLLDESGAVKVVAQPTNAYVVRAAFDQDSLRGTLHDPSGARVLKEDYPWPGDGSVVRRFASEIVIALTGQPAVPTGTIVFSGLAGPAREIFACAPDGSGLHPLTQDRSLAESPALSPDGTELVFTTRTADSRVIDRIELASGKRDRLFSSPGTNTGAAFARDGHRLAFTMTFSGNAELYTARPGGRPRRVSESPGQESSPSWSPDGRRLAFVYQLGAIPQVFLTEAGGGQPVRVDTGFEWSDDPDWSPDGAKLAITVRAAGKTSVAVHLIDGGRTTVVCTGSEPVWAPDSRHLAFVQDGNLVLVDTVTGRKSVVVAGRAARQPAWVP